MDIKASDLPAIYLLAVFLLVVILWLAVATAQLTGEIRKYNKAQRAVSALGKYHNWLFALMEATGEYVDYVIEEFNGSVSYEEPEQDRFDAMRKTLNNILNEMHEGAEGECHTQ